MTTAEVITPEEKTNTTVQVIVSVDTKAAFIRGEIVAPETLVPVDISTLSSFARTVLWDGTKGDLTFELRDPEKFSRHAAIDQPTTAKIVAILEEKGASLEKALLEKEARAQAYEQRQLQNRESFLSASPDRGTIYIKRDLGIEQDVYIRNGQPPSWLFGTEGWLTADFQRKLNRDVDKVTPDLIAHIERFDKENAALAQELSGEVAAFFAKEDKEVEDRAAEKKAQEEAAKAAALAAEAARSKERLKSGEYTEDFDDYDEDRYDTPWAALVTLNEDGRSSVYEYVSGAFDGADGEEGTVSVPCKPGEVIAVGQEDTEGSCNLHRILLMEEDGSMKALTRSEATKHLRAKAKA